ncbi:MAG: hypothetical protein ACR2GN_09475 [Bacteroidia bacterium]
MKKINLLNVKSLAFVVLLSGVSLVSCDDRREYDQPLNDYEAYVDKTSNDTGEWTEQRWNETEAEYRERRAAVELHVDKMDEPSRTRYQEADRKYEDLKRQYDEQRAQSQQQSGSVTNLYATVGSAGSNDLQLNSVTAENLLASYRGFVDQVEANKDNYSVEDWKEIEIIWDALNRRKNEVEPNLASEDNMKIAELKIKYGWVKTGNKMEAKAEEKSDETQKK